MASSNGPATPSAAVSSLPTSSSSSSSSNTTYMENGREYGGFRRGQYMYPCDEKEKNRMDLFHQMFLVARHDYLHSARIDSSDDIRILDLGTGTGIWAIDMADRFHHAEVVGMDLSNIQPQTIPPNLRFHVPVDYLSPWAIGEESWDLVHLRQACGSVHHWPDLYQKIFNHLKPGVGSIEHVEIDLTPRCDNGPVPHYLSKWYEDLERATQTVNRPIKYHQNTRALLEAAGFVNIQEQTIKLPYNTWPADRHSKSIGRWYCVGMQEWVHALSLQPFHRTFDWTRDQIDGYVDNVVKCMTNRKFQGYNQLHIWTATRPKKTGPE